MKYQITQKNFLFYEQMHSIVIVGQVQIYSRNYSTFYQVCRRLALIWYSQVQEILRNMKQKAIQAKEKEDSILFSIPKTKDMLVKDFICN